MGLTRQTYRDWSAGTLDRMWGQCPGETEAFEKAAESVRDQTPAGILDRLRAAYADYARAARSKGLEFVQPAMTLLEWYNSHEDGKGELSTPTPEELPFVPLPGSLAADKPLAEEMAARYKDHVDHLVKPFLRRIRRCRRQLVLVDVLRVLRNGVDAYNDTRSCISEVLRAYHDAWHAPFRGVTGVLFAATKADHATRNYRANMSRLLDELVSQAEGNVKGGVPISSSEWFTSLRATQDAHAEQHGRPFDVLLGSRKGDGTTNGDVMKKGDGQTGGYYPGAVPSDWPDGDGWVQGNRMYDFPEFEPKPLPRKDGAVLPHMNLDKVIWEVLQHCF